MQAAAASWHVEVEDVARARACVCVCVCVCVCGGGVCGGGHSSRRPAGMCMPESNGRLERQTARERERERERGGGPAPCHDLTRINTIIL
jgi:hypothetical protein